MTFVCIILLTFSSQQTWEGQWSFEGDNLILRAATVDRVIELAQPATFTFEFWPRVEGNVAEYTLSP